MVQNLSELTVFSLNTKGFNQLRQDYIADIVSFCDILCIQEHWLFKQHLHKIETCIPNFHGHAVSGMSDGDILHGRPHGGCAILWRSDISQNVLKLSIDSNRLCAIRLNLNGHCIIIVCLYLPTDTHGNAFNQQSIEMVLGEIQYTVQYIYIIISNTYIFTLKRNRFTSH